MTTHSVINPLAHHQTKLDTVKTMKTAPAVEDGKLTNEGLGALQRRLNEITRRINEGTLTYDYAMDGLQRTIEGRIAGEPRQWDVWKTLTLGTGLKTADDFRTSLKADGHNIGDYANDILGKPAFTASETKTEVELVLVTVAELGFKSGAKRSDIYAKAQELGLDLCPAEVGPQLRLQYKDQQKGEWILVGMEPITDSDGDLLVVGVLRSDDGESWLDSDSGGPDLVWYADGRWVFLRRK